MANNFIYLSQHICYQVGMRAPRCLWRILNITSGFSNTVKSIKLKIFSQISLWNFSVCKYLKKLFIHKFLTHLLFFFLIFIGLWSCYYNLYENDALFHNYILEKALLLLLLSRFSRVRLCATPWTAAYQVPPSMGSSRQEYWSGLPLPSPRKSTSLGKLISVS